MFGSLYIAYGSVCELETQVFHLVTGLCPVMLGRFEALPRHLIDCEAINLLFVRFPIERLFSQTRGRVLFAKANNWGNALVLCVYSDLRQSLDRSSDQMFGRLASQTLYQGDMTLQGGAL